MEPSETTAFFKSVAARPPQSSSSSSYSSTRSIGVGQNIVVNGTNYSSSGSSGNSKGKSGGRDKGKKHKHHDDHDHDNDNDNDQEPNNGGNNDNTKGCNQFKSPAAKGILIALLIMIVLAGALVGIFYGILQSAFNTESLLNCARFNALGSGIIPGDCSFAQRQYFGGTCVLPCPDGYNHTATCTCEKGTTETDCTKYGKSSPPDTCPLGRDLFGSGCLQSCPDGFTRTAHCSCQKGSTRTDCGKYAVKSYTPTKCPNGREYYAGQCWLPCPPGYSRTAGCTCSKGGVDYNCEVYNKNSYTPTKCPSGRDYYGSTCVQGCPAEYARTAACTCETGELVTDCGAFGFKQGLDCSGNKTNVGGLCYTSCPYNGKRTAACTCFYSEAASPGIVSPNTECPQQDYKYPDLGNAACYYPCQYVTSNALDGGGSKPVQVTCLDSNHPVPGGNGQCYQYSCPNGGARIDSYTCQYPGEITSTDKIYTCPSGTIWNCADGPGAACYYPDGIVFSINGNCPTWAGGVWSSTQDASTPLPQPCKNGLVRGTGDLLCYDPCPTFSGISGERVNQGSCKYGSSDSPASSTTPSGSCPGWAPIDFGGRCYAYSGYLALAGYNDFYGGDFVTADLSCPDPNYQFRDGGLTCYQNGCPNNFFGQQGSRTGPKTCFWPCNSNTNPIPPLMSCPSSHPLFYASACHTLESTQTDCGLLGGGIGTIPDSCPDGMDIYASGCYGKCLPGYSRSILCTCSNLHVITDCGLYGQPTAIGTNNGPKCDDKADLLAGVCYENKCPEGKTRTGACTCSDASIITDCKLYGDPRPIGDALGPQCEFDADLYGSLCYTPKCEPGATRTASCTCDDIIVETNCTKYGDFKPIGDPLGPGCSGTKDLYGGLCYDQACVGGKKRTASCTCSDYDIKTDCEEHGDARGPGDKDGLGPKCFPGYDDVGGLCYKESCPSGYYRISICECKKAS